LTEKNNLFINYIILGISQKRSWRTCFLNIRETFESKTCIQENEGLAAQKLSRRKKEF